MSGLAELMRESPAYKKAVLAVAVTAGVGACAYYGYRCATRHCKGAAPGPTPPRGGSSKPGKKTDSHQEESSIKREPLLGKEKAKDIEPVKIIPPSKVETVHITGSPRKADELSTSGTFEKISLAPNESDNFEHLTMSQVHPTTSLTHEGKDEKHDVDVSLSSISFLPSESEDSASISILNPSGMFESLSASQSGQSMSFITPPTAQEEAFSKSSVELSKDASELLASASGVKLKDENDIVVVEPNSDDSSFEKGEEKVPSATAVADFDASRISPVFGCQSYHRVEINPNEVFDPAKSHPASFGFRFGANIC